MNIRENISLKGLNTFGIDVKARYLGAFTNLPELEEIAAFASIGKGLPLLILGGGSNMLFTRDVDGLVLKNEIPGIEKIKEDDDHVYIKTGAGENWHRFVLHCLENGWSGMENLALIPGLAGATPMQNIGAYGVEIKDVFESLEAFHIHEKKIMSFSAADCAFGYRESVFKNKWKGQFVITSVTYRLNKKPRLKLDYGAITAELERMQIGQPDPMAVARAVINIRRSKLPDPQLTGNAGSFFKNPEVGEEQFLTLKEKHPGIVGYLQPGSKVKLAAGWLIEKCGWKGYRNGDAGCHEFQALVLVNYGHASGADILQLAQKIKAEVQSTFGVLLEEEVNII
jgi:UDP-N-acetylmuramate dehydrogenase